MSQDSLSDPQIDALRELLHGGLNAILQPKTGEEVVVTTYGWPITLARAAQMQLPMLVIYRASEQMTEHTSVYDEHVVTLRFDYYASATPLDKIGSRWPLLKSVWRELVLLIQAGSHAAVEGGAPVLSDAGWTEVDLGTARVNYPAPADGETVYPRFEGTLTMTSQEVPDTSALPDLSLDMQYRLDQLPTPEQPLVEEILGQ